MDSFLKVFRRVVALIRGFPKIVYSDRGTQLIAANKQQDRMSTSGEGAYEMMNFSVTGGSAWKFTKSANSPWQNGFAEALIRSVKRCIQIAVGENVLSYGELQAVFF